MRRAGLLRTIRSADLHRQNKTEAKGASASRSQPIMTPVSSLITEHPHGITAIDAEYMRPRADASHLIVRDGRAAFVDTGTTHSVPGLLAALDAKGIDRAQVDYLLITHVHLDHAGGAGSLARALPGARVVVHPRGARHLSDPAKLIQGSIAVYGPERFAALYGEIIPIPEERLHQAADGERLFLGKSPLELIHTPGHALHHYCIIDPGARAIFSGDTFGLSYRETDSAQGAFIFPTTTPVQFDPQALHVSVDRLLAYQPESIYLTHYSRITSIPKLGRDLHARIDGLVGIAKRQAQAHAKGPQRTQAIAAELFEWLCTELDAHGTSLTRAQRWELLGGDVELNTQGLEVWLDKPAKAA